MIKPLSKKLHLTQDEASLFVNAYFQSNNITTEFLKPKKFQKVKPNIEDSNEELFKKFKRAYYLVPNLSEPSGSFGKYLWERLDYEIERNCILFFKKFESHLGEDSAILKNNFSFSSKDICNIDFFGDPHDNGEKVVKVTDSSGKTIFYKPRPTNSIEVYNYVISQVSKELGVKLPKIFGCHLYRHGWTKLVDGKILPDNLSFNEQVQYGTLIAVSVFLGISDLHYENVIFTADGPLILDYDIFLRGIIRKGVDEYAFFMSPFSTGLVTASRKDFTRSPVDAVKNLDPSLISEGFERTLIFLLKNDSVISYVQKTASELTCRYLIRHTHTYEQIINKIKHTAVQNDELYYLRLISQLSCYSLRDKFIAHFLPQEIASIGKLDIPYFEEKVSESKFTSISGIDFFNLRTKVLKEKLKTMSSLLKESIFLTNDNYDKDQVPISHYSISDISFTRDSEKTFISPCIKGEDSVVSTLSLDLYSGLPGVLLYEYLSRKSSYPEVYNTIRKRMNKSLGQIEPGFLSGGMGACYVMALVSLDNKKEIEEYINNFLEKSLEIKILDYMTGLAGIVCCIYLIEKNTSLKLNQILVKKTIEYFINEISNRNLDEYPGIAHGESGVCFGLEVVKHLTPEKHDRYNLRLLQKNLFDEEIIRWKNNHYDELSAWCIGAHGMLKAREAIFDNYSQNDLLKKRVSCIKKNSLFRGLCHGVEGLELMGYNLEKEGINRSEINKWSSTKKLRCVGLFTGISGALLFEELKHNKNKLALFKELLLPL